ncbi:MAG: hypothetical protein ACKPKO_61415 [Candidatus Fonsibacter sp.]
MQNYQGILLKLVCSACGQDADMTMGCVGEAKTIYQLIMLTISVATQLPHQ